MHSHPESAASLANHTSFSDLVLVFEKQFRHWRDRSELAARNCGAEDGDVRFMIGNIRLYHNYARLVVRSFGLQKATDDNGTDLPAAFLEVSQDAELLTQSDLYSTSLLRPHS
jgi:hypothetical protein